MARLYFSVSSQAKTSTIFFREFFRSLVIIPFSVKYENVGQEPSVWKDDQREEIRELPKPQIIQLKKIPNLNQRHTDVELNLPYIHSKYNFFHKMKILNFMLTFTVVFLVSLFWA